VFSPEGIALVSAVVAALTNVIVAPIAKRHSALLVSAALSAAMALFFILVAPLVLGKLEAKLALTGPALYILLGAAPILTVGTFLYWLSVQRLGASVAYPIASSYPLLVSVFGFVVLREPFSVLKLAGTVAIIGGVSLVSVSSADARSQTTAGPYWKALLVAFLTMLCWSGNTILVKLAVDGGVGIFAVNLLRMPVMAVLLSAALFARGGGREIVSMQRKALLVLLVAAVISGFQDLLYFYTLQASKLSIVVPLSSTAPMFVMILALVFLKERVTLPRALGTLVTVVGIILLA
jgi:drug/metabolite transporter (DMT)-like permease